MMAGNMALLGLVILEHREVGHPEKREPIRIDQLLLFPYLQTHLTMREIGDRLFVSRNTVSSEVTSIYRKLGVSSRNDAVERATAIDDIGSRIEAVAEAVGAPDLGRELAASTSAEIEAVGETPTVARARRPPMPSRSSWRIRRSRSPP